MTRNVIDGFLDHRTENVKVAVRYLSADVDTTVFEQLSRDLNPETVREAMSTWVEMCDGVYSVLSEAHGFSEDHLLPAGNSAAFHTAVHQSLAAVMTGSWVPALGYRDGLWTGCVAEVRDRIAGVAGLVAPVAPIRDPMTAAVRDPAEFMRLCLIAIEQLELPALERVRRTFELSDTGLAQLFGVSRQAVTKWEERAAVPAARRVAVEQAAVVADFLAERLIRGGPAALLDIRAPAFGDHSLREMLIAGRSEEALIIYRRGFELQPRLAQD